MDKSKTDTLHKRMSVFDLSVDFLSFNCSIRFVIELNKVINY